MESSRSWDEDVRKLVCSGKCQVEGKWEGVGLSLGSQLHWGGGAWGEKTAGAGLVDVEKTM